MNLFEKGVLNKRNNYEMEYNSLRDQNLVLKVDELSTKEENGFKLKNISFEVSKNELILITGGNGCGKVSIRRLKTNIN
jgi:ABC-type polysaccharide/polyol phosphate transport system ATPase subunit